MTIKNQINQKDIEHIYDNVIINETREIILKIFLGNKISYTRKEVINVLEAYYLKKYGDVKKYPWTTVYDNLNALLVGGVLMKHTMPNPLKRGRPIVKWAIDNKAIAKALLEESQRRNS